MQNEHPVIVIGGGIAGLSAALSLSEVGLAPLLLERDPQGFGGRVSAKPSIDFVHAGKTWHFSMEHGIHGWWNAYRNFLDLLARYGLEDRLVPAQDQTLVYFSGDDAHRIHVGRRTQQTRMPAPLHHLPLMWDPRFVARLRLREWQELYKVLARLLETLRLDPLNQLDRARYDSMGSDAYARELPDIVASLMLCLTRAGFFADAHDVSLLAFLQSLQYYVFLHKSYQSFSFCRGPIVPTLMQPLREALERQGGEVRLGWSVRQVQREDDRTWRVQARAGRRTVTLRSQALVLALDMPGAQQLCETSPDLRQVYGDLSPFKARPSGIIRHFWPGQPRDTATCGVIAGAGNTGDAYFWLDQFQGEFAAWRYQTGGSVSEVHVYNLDLLQNATDTELARGVERDLRKAFPSLGQPVHVAVVRNAATNSCFAPGTIARQAAVATKYSNLALCGDWIDPGCLSFFMERACLTGLQAANVMRTWHGKPPAHVHLFSPPAQHVQWIQRSLRWMPRILPMKTARSA